MPLGRPRKYATQAERQRAYRARIKARKSSTIEPKSSPAPPITKFTTTSVEPLVKKTSRKAVSTAKTPCQMYAPHGTRCRFCGQAH